jgi:hypothetical protein
MAFRTNSEVGAKMSVHIRFVASGCALPGAVQAVCNCAGCLSGAFHSVCFRNIRGRGTLFFMEGFLGARYGAAARRFVLHQKFASVAMLVALVVIVVAIRWLPSHRRNQQSPTV